MHFPSGQPAGIGWQRLGFRRHHGWRHLLVKNERSPSSKKNESVKAHAPLSAALASSLGPARRWRAADGVQVEVLLYLGGHHPCAELAALHWRTMGLIDRPTLAGGASCPSSVTGAHGVLPPLAHQPPAPNYVRGMQVIAVNFCLSNIQAKGTPTWHWHQIYRSAGTVFPRAAR